MLNGFVALQNAYKTLSQGLMTVETKANRSHERINAVEPRLAQLERLVAELASTPKTAAAPTFDADAIKRNLEDSVKLAKMHADASMNSASMASNSASLASTSASAASTSASAASTSASAAAASSTDAAASASQALQAAASASAAVTTASTQGSQASASAAQASASAAQASAAASNALAAASRASDSASEFHRLPVMSPSPPSPPSPPPSSSSEPSSPIPAVVNGDADSAVEIPASVASVVPVKKAAAPRKRATAKA